MKIFVMGLAMATGLLLGAPPQQAAPGNDRECCQKCNRDGRPAGRQGNQAGRGRHRHNCGNQAAAAPAAPDKK